MLRIKNLTFTRNRGEWIAKHKDQAIAVGHKHCLDGLTYDHQMRLETARDRTELRKFLDAITNNYMILIQNTVDGQKKGDYVGLYKISDLRVNANTGHVQFTLVARVAG